MIYLIKNFEFVAITQNNIYVQIWKDLENEDAFEGVDMRLEAYQAQHLCFYLSSKENRIPGHFSFIAANAQKALLYC